MDEKNIATLRYESNFCTEIGKNVFWVPVRELGESNYSNIEMKYLCSLSPEEKQKQITTLYEALQLFVLSEFTETLDIVNIEEDGNIWEHHKPGYFAVKTNTGCCATTSSWLTYILDNKYEEVGLLCFSRPDGSGHVFNYIKQHTWYYIIDLMPFTHQYISHNCAETGLKSDFVKSKYVTSICVKTKNLHDYAIYFNRIVKCGGFEFVFYKQEAKCAAPVCVKSVNEYQLIGYPRDYKVTCLTPDTCRIKTTFIEGPTTAPDWLTICEG